MFTIYDVEKVKKEKIILPGNDHFIGKDEKRKNAEIINIQFPQTFGNYALFYKGTHEKLKIACYAIENLLNDPNMIPKYSNTFYKTLIEQLHIVHHQNTETRKSKLAGINSLSTSCLDNLFCLERMKKADCICSHCYADTQQKTQLALQDRNTINGIILRNIIIPVNAWKKYFPKSDLSKFFRFESFGDTANKTQAINYINICKAFPKVHFAIWTKNPGIFYFAFDETEGKPENLSFIVSSDKINIPRAYIKDVYKFTDHVFTVYDKPYIKANNININCGGRSCMECIKQKKACYFTGTEYEISEQLK